MLNDVDRANSIVKQIPELLRTLSHMYRNGS